MKNRFAIAAALLPCALWAIPQSPVVTYGLVRDEYGNPLKRSSSLELRLVRDAEPDGTVYAKAVVGETAYATMNYRLSLEIDSTGPDRAYAVLSGTMMRIRGFMDGQEQHLTPTPVFAAPENGAAVRRDWSLGEDADGDGLPDTWEKWALQGAGRSYDAAAVAAFSPDADSDGDGMSNGKEFFCGTDPFLSTDLFTITSYERTGASGRTEIRFTTVPGRTYRVLASPTLDGAVWAPVATTRTPAGATSFETYSGTGREITVYTDTPADENVFYKVAVN